MAYVSGAHWKICDRTGFKVRSYDTRKEWNGLIVRSRSWEARQPQDFVRGVRDDQAVPEPRPRQTDVFVGEVQTTVAVSAPARANSLIVASVVGFSVGDRIAINLDTGDTFFDTLTSVAVATATLGLTKPLPQAASIGNVVTDMTSAAVSL